jgi:RNA polymerase sigma-70 factor, ECF subfamily
MVSSMEPLSDEDLISCWRAKAPSAESQGCLNELFQRHHARVALWCLRLTGDRESAADLAQEVFIKAYGSLQHFRGDAKFSTWLYTIARNHCYNQIKARAKAPERTAEPLTDNLAEEREGPHERLERERSSQLVGELFQQSLTTLESQVMTLHYLEELSLEVVTRLLKLENQSGAKSYIVSARRKLARAVERLKERGQKIHL